MPGAKNPVQKRQLGNRLIVAMAKNIGEEAQEDEPLIGRMISSMCLNTDYLVRHEAAIFFKDYFEENAQKLIGTERLQDYYLPEIYELLVDEESYVRVEAIEATLEILEQLDLDIIEEKFMPGLIKGLDIEENHIENIVRMSKMIGKIVYKLSHFELHTKYQEQFLTFFRGIVSH